MPNPATAPCAAHPIDPRTGLTTRVADQLIPLFASPSTDISLARQMATSAIHAYEPQTRADFVNVARTIAFSMAALALLGQTAGQDTTMAEKLRAFGRANALNRSADQSERTMMQRRRYRQATSPAEQADDNDPAADLSETDVDFNDPAIDAAVTEAINAYRARRRPDETQAPPPASVMAPVTTTPQTCQATPVVSPRQHAGATATPAIYYGRPNAASTQPSTVTFKEGLMRHSAIHRAVAAGDRPNSG